MANVPLQAAISSNLFGESKPGYLVGGRVEGVVYRQLNSVSVSSSAVGSERRGVARSSWVLEEFFQIGLSKEQTRGKKNSSRVRAKPQQWHAGIRAGNGESSNYEIAKDTSLENVSRGGATSEDFFRDQVYDYGGREDSYRGDPPPERARGVTSDEDEAFILSEDLDEPFDVQGDAEEFRLGYRRQEWAQYDAKGRPDADRRGTNERAHNGDLDYTRYGGQLVTTRARREQENDVVDRSTEELSREEVLEDGEYMEYEGNNTIEQTSRAPANSSEWEDGRELAGDDEYRQEIEEKFLFEEDPEGNLNSNTNEDPWQRSDQTKGQSYRPKPDWDCRSPVEDREDDFVLRNAQDDDDFYDRGSPSNELGAVEERQGPPAGDFDDRYYFQNSGEYKISSIADGEEQDQILPNRGSTDNERGNTDNERISSRNYGRDPEQDMSARGALYAKQVISLSTAESLGFVTQLWVDLATLKVVALEVRPNLLFGYFNNFPLKSLSKVGDVILIDDDIVLKERDLYSCSDLVGSDLFTEVGVFLGKVRDYNFSLEDGAVLSLEFDKFGVPLIPSSLVKTYSLTVDEVIESEGDCLFLRKGAEKRVQKLSKGFFSLYKQSSKGRQSAWRQQRKQAPEIQYLGPASERVGRIVERDNYTPRQQPRRGSGISSRSENLRYQESNDYQDVQSSRSDLPVRNRPQISEYEQSEDPGLGISMPEMTRNAKGLPMSYRTSRKSVQSDF